MRIMAYPAFSNRAVNPYTSLLYESIRPLVYEIVEYRTMAATNGRIDIFHVHWPDLIVSEGNSIRAAARTAAFLLRTTECKARGAKLVWTVHNIAPHDGGHSLLEATLWPAFVPLLDGLIFMSMSSRADGVAARPALARLPYTVIPHGHYKPVVGKLIGRAEARDRLGLPQGKFIFLHFGNLRAYKNVPLLIQQFLALNQPETYLAIAGDTASRGDLRQTIEQLAAGRDNIRLDLRFIPDDTLLEYLAACDVVVLPYSRILNSGSVLLALSAGRPVISPRTGSLAEIASQVGHKWMQAYAGSFDSSQLAEAIEQRPPPWSAPDLSRFNWKAIGEQTVDFYRNLNQRTTSRAADADVPV